ncbi:MAG: lytic murein transglycosylase B [Steroidobacteraceae bacterium]
MTTRLPRQHLPRPYALLATGLLVAPGAQAIDATREDVSGFIGRMSTEHGFDAAALAAVLTDAQSNPDILSRISKPAEKTLTWQEYRARFITERRISRGVAVANAQAAALDRAATAGVPANYLLAITGVETFYGEVTGKFRVVDALATLGFDYPPRSPFFRGQLEEYLLMTREESLDPLVPLGSYAGAMGIPQFMPGSFRAYAVDGDGDGKRDLWNDWSDVFASVANYLLKNGWKPGEPVMAPADASAANLEGLPADKLTPSETVGSLRARGVRFQTTLPDDAPAVLVPLVVDSGIEYRVGFQNYYAITRYNRSELYASAVNDLAESIAAVHRAPPPPFSSGPAADAPAPPSTEPTPGSPQ